MKQLKSKIKKSISILLACVIALSVFAVGVSAEDAAWPEYVKYTITDGEAEITSCSCRFTRYETVVIPETVEGCPVVSIRPAAFEHCIYHDTILLPSTIKSIGNRGLDGNFKKIEVDENNLYYSSDDYGVLYNKNKTEIVQYPTGKSETSYIVPVGVETIGKFSFYSSYITEITFSDTVKIIGLSAFDDNNGLEIVDIPDSVEKIDSYAFSGCDKLKEINVGKGVSIIGYRAFNSSIERVNISADNRCFFSDEKGVVYTKDTNLLFYYPRGNTDDKYIIPEGVVGFGTEAPDTTFLKELVISSTVKDIDRPFDTCKALERITVVENNPYFSNDEFGVLYNKDKTELVRCPRAVTFTSYVVPDNVENLGKYAFADCKALETIQLSPNITKISQFALRNLKALKTLYLPAGVKSFGEQSFLGTTNVTDIYYYGTEKQWNSLGGKDYLQNDILKTATIHFNYGVASGSCGESSTWLFNEENGYLTISGNGVLEEKTSFNDYGWYSFKDKITYVEVQSGITNVPAFAFEGCTELKEVYLSETVSSIGGGAFSGCANLKVVSSTNENAITIGENAISADGSISIICKDGNTSLASLSVNNTIIVTFDEEKKILHFVGDITVYPDVEYNFLNKFMLERTNSEYILFDKVVFEGVRPDYIDPSQFENMEAGETNLTLTNLYVSLKVIQGETERTITFEEMLKLLEEGNFDVFKYVIESAEESGEKTFLVRIGEYVVEFTERALRAVSSVINFIAKLFKKK